MSISSELSASARAAYRALYRASSTTFFGDTRVLTEFRNRMRADMPRKADSTPEHVQEYITSARDTASFLQKNIVQAQNVEGDTWRTHLHTLFNSSDTAPGLRITKDTELGDNESIKLKSRFSRDSTSSPTTESPTTGVDREDSRLPQQRMNFSDLKKRRQTRLIPELDENDLEESFVRGSGPGGQSINKTQNKVQLLHKPTNIRVSCQETRSLLENRKIARSRLKRLLDEQQNPGMSRDEFLKARKRERERQRKKKRAKRDKAKESGL
ncbi:RF-1 domain-containing protein [Flagelloscypha sp. PMI_526]|nr:RF-1 domain-containing protein [Flagelloscypha sp. PMI_526]